MPKTRRAGRKNQLRKFARLRSRAQDEGNVPVDSRADCEHTPQSPSSQQDGNSGTGSKTIICPLHQIDTKPSFIQPDKMPTNKSSFDMNNEKCTENLLQDIKKSVLQSDVKCTDQ